MPKKKKPITKKPITKKKVNKLAKSFGKGALTILLPIDELKLVFTLFKKN